jgi:hypothetical protein
LIGSCTNSSYQVRNIHFLIFFLNYTLTCVLSSLSLVRTSPAPPRLRGRHPRKGSKFPANSSSLREASRFGPRSFVTGSRRPWRPSAAWCLQTRAVRALASGNAMTFPRKHQTRSFPLIIATLEVAMTGTLEL